MGVHNQKSEPHTKMWGKKRVATEQLKEFKVPKAGVAPVAPKVVSCATAADLEVIGGPSLTSLPVKYTPAIDGFLLLPTY